MYLDNENFLCGKKGWKKYEKSIPVDLTGKQLQIVVGIMKKLLLMVRSNGIEFEKRVVIKAPLEDGVS